MKRLIRIDYSGGAGDRVCRASSLEGAVRAAMIRIVHGQYLRAVIHDERYGTGFDTSALIIGRTVAGIQVRYASERPRWNMG